MPDDAGGLYKAKDFRTAIPFALMTAGALSLLRGAPLLGLGLLGGWLYPIVEKADRDRRKQGRSLKARRAAGQRLDIALEDSFPASDPPSLGGI